MDSFNDITDQDTYVELGPSLERADWLLGILGLSDSALPAIRSNARNLVWEYELDHAAKSKQEICDLVSSSLIKTSAIKTGAIGSITAVPAVLPFFGTIASAVLGTTVDLAFLIRTQIELCYAISAVYESEIDEEELKAVTLALLGFSGSAEMVKGIATSTLRSIVDETVAKYLTKGIANAAVDTAGKIGPRLFIRAYKLIPLVGISLCASINITSTMMVGKHARQYFSSWNDDVSR